MTNDKNELADALQSLGSATLGESGARLMAPRMTAAWAGAELAAPAYTVRCAPGDNLAVHVAVAQAPTGSVLVVDVGATAERGYWGEVLTTGAEARGIVGLVIDGGVRDVKALEAHGFPVFSALVALRGATKVLPGSVGQTVNCGGIPVSTGDWIVGDVDGVVVIDQAKVDEVLANGRGREAKEAGYFEALKAGQTTVELLDLDASLIKGQSVS